MKDKYQKKKLWFWCDVSYQGTQEETEREQLTRQTEIGSGCGVPQVSLGLSKLNPVDKDSDDPDDDDESDDGDDESEGSESGDETGAEEPRKGPKSKNPRGNQKPKDKRKRQSSEEVPDEDMDAVPDLLEEMLKIESRASSILDRCASYGASEMKTKKLREDKDKLSKLHDELADFKAAHDSEETVDSKKICQLIADVNKLTSRMTMEENKIKKTVLAGRKPADGKTKSPKKGSHVSPKGKAAPKGGPKKPRK